MARRILFRADGASVIGYGHIFRIIALADILKNEFECILLTQNMDFFVQRQCQISGLTVIPINNSFQYSLPADKKDVDEIPYDLNGYVKENDIVVLDGYWFGPMYQYWVKQNGAFLVCIDDLVAIDYTNADIVINHAPAIDYKKYKISAQTKLCLGLDYLILRQAFFNLPKAKDGRFNKVYISFGASDYFEITTRIVKVCLEIPEISEIHVLTSDSYNDQTMRILNLQKARFEGKLFLYKNLCVNDVVNLIEICTHAILSASTVALEVITQQVKPLIGYYASNQLSLYKGLINEDLCFGIGDISKKQIGKEQILNYIQSDSIISKRFDNVKLKQLFLSI